jgi:hypothetical protein
MDVREMYRSAKTPSQLFGDLNRLHRHFREVDRDDDVLNVQRFHAHSMKYLQLGGSALLAKSHPFFAKRHPEPRRRTTRVLASVLREAAA